MLRINANWGRAGYIVTCLLWGMELTSDISTSYRYIFLMAAIAVYAVLLYFSARDGRRAETGVIWRMCAVFAVFFAFTFLAMFTNNFAFYGGRDFFQLFMPSLFAFLIYNTESESNMDFYFDGMFLTQGACYIISILPKMTLQNFLSISIKDSYCPFESLIASRLTILVIYYWLRKKPFRCSVAFVLNFLAFKRMNLVYAFLIVTLGWLVNRIRLKDSYLNIAKCVFILSPLTLRLMCSDAFVSWFDSTFSQSFQSFTSARVLQYTFVLSYDGPLLGLGAVENFTRTNYWIQGFHSDVLRYSIEMTMLGYAVFVICMFDMLKVRRGMVKFSVMVFAFFIMYGSILVGDFPAFFLIFLMMHVDTDAMNAIDAKKKALRAAGKTRASAAPESGALQN